MSKAYPKLFGDVGEGISLLAESDKSFCKSGGFSGVSGRSEKSSRVPLVDSGAEVRCEADMSSSRIHHIGICGCIAVEGISVKTFRPKVQGAYHTNSRDL